jgi:hypothetical protein
VVHLFLCLSLLLGGYLLAEIAEHLTQIPSPSYADYQSNQRKRRACDYQTDGPKKLPKTHISSLYPTVAALRASITGARPNNEPITRPPAAKPKAAKPVTFSPQCKKK